MTTIYNPQEFTLIHKKSGRRYSTKDLDWISYSEDKFEKIEPTQKQLFNY